MTTSRNSKPNAFLKILIPFLAILLAVMGGLYFIKSQLGSPPRAMKDASAQTAQVVPDLTLTRLDGTQEQLSLMTSKVIILNFWATWCEACMEEMPSIVQLKNAYSGKGLEVIGVNLDENPQIAVPRVIKQFQINFPIYQDPDGKIADIFDVHAIPLTIVMNQHRKILLTHDGDRDWNAPDVHQEIDRWLAQ